MLPSFCLCVCVCICVCAVWAGIACCCNAKSKKKGMNVCYIFICDACIDRDHIVQILAKVSCDRTETKLEASLLFKTFLLFK